VVFKKTHIELSAETKSLLRTACSDEATRSAPNPLDPSDPFPTLLILASTGDEAAQQKIFLAHHLFN
jgi:hypothetical protein